MDTPPLALCCFQCSEVKILKIKDYRETAETVHVLLLHSNKKAK